MIFSRFLVDFWSVKYVLITLDSFLSLFGHCRWKRGRKVGRLIARFIQGTRASQSVTTGRTSHFNQNGVQAIIYKEMQWSCDEWKTTQAENSQKHFKGKIGNGRRNLCSRDSFPNSKAITRRNTKWDGRGWVGQDM